ADALDAVDQIGKPFQRVVLALHGDDHAVGGDQRVDGEHRQRRRAVDEDEVVVLAHRGQRVAQPALLHLHVEQGDFGGGQVAVGRQQLVATVLGELHGIAEAALADQHVVDGVLESVLVDARTHGGVALRVEIDQQDATLGGNQRGGQVDAGGGLADSTLLVGNRENPSHAPRLPPGPSDAVSTDGVGLGNQG